MYNYSGEYKFQLYKSKSNIKKRVLYEEISEFYFKYLYSLALWKVKKL